jgi:hypothetical protein
MGENSPKPVTLAPCTCTIWWQQNETSVIRRVVIKAVAAAAAGAQQPPFSIIFFGDFSVEVWPPVVKVSSALMPSSFGVGVKSRGEKVQVIVFDRFSIKSQEIKGQCCCCLRNPKKYNPCSRTFVARRGRFNN